jgi:hypothetical protein
MIAARVTLALAITAGYAAAVFSDAEPAVMAFGLAPLAWLALEAGWRLLD